MLYSRCLLLNQASWLGREIATYEDWSIVENSAAFDPLNEGAVTGVCQEPHRLVARWTVGSGAGLYKLHTGDVTLPVVRQTYRFNKPTVMTYADFYALVQPFTEQSQGCIWLR